MQRGSLQLKRDGTRFELELLPNVSCFPLGIKHKVRLRGSTSFITWVNSVEQGSPGHSESGKEDGCGGPGQG